MANPKEGLYQSVKQSFGEKAPLLSTPEKLDDKERIVHFAMACNGYSAQNGIWEFSPDAIRPLTNEFKGEKVSFFGPSSQDNFFSSKDRSLHHVAGVFGQDSVIGVLKKFEEIDTNQAARIAFLFGGILRQMPKIIEDKEKARNVIDFAARVTKLGDEKSGDAVAAAISMYLISGGSTEPDNTFMRNIYNMAGAFHKDPINPTTTTDFGDSQLARLRGFTGEESSFPDISEEQRLLRNLPTVGAEFHILEQDAKGILNLLKKLTVLNISQYQKGSQIQFSRNDQNVMEIRMNPSTYPITIANWAHLKLLMPDLQKLSFTTTYNRQELGKDFDWHSDSILLNRLIAIGMLGYAQMYESIPPVSTAEVDFGTAYLGQTVRRTPTETSYTGGWNGGRGKSGQLGIYAGYGNNFGHLAYYPSMILANPHILDEVDPQMLDKITNFTVALALTSQMRKNIFRELDSRIRIDPALNRAAKVGNSLMENLMP